jgi:Derlin-2/3
MSSVEDWFKSIPPFTRYYLVTALASTILVSMGLLNPNYLYMNLSEVVSKLHVWRLLTSFVFFGKFGMGFFFSLVVL